MAVISMFRVRYRNRRGLGDIRKDGGRARGGRRGDHQSRCAGGHSGRDGVESARPMPAPRIVKRLDGGRWASGRRIQVCRRHTGQGAQPFGEVAEFGLAGAVTTKIDRSSGALGLDSCRAARCGAPRTRRPARSASRSSGRSGVPSGHVRARPRPAGSDRFRPAVPAGV